MAKPETLICWHNGSPMGERSARILRDQLEVVELGERILIAEAIEHGVAVVCFPPLGPWR